jgi:hypothetical protein
MSWIDRCASPNRGYFHLPDEREGVQYLESAAQPVVSGDRVRAVDQLAGPIDTSAWVSLTPPRVRYHININH